MMRSLHNLILFILCILYLPLRGTARKNIGVPKRVCIIQFAQFGDMICTTPMFRAIKKAYPDAEVYVVGKAINKEVVNGNPDVSEYIVWKENTWKTIKHLRSLKCDFGTATGPNYVALAILYLAGVPSIAAARLVDGSSPLETRPYRILRHLAHVIPHSLPAYVPREYLRLLEPIGIRTDDTKKFVYFTKEALIKVKDALQVSAIGDRRFAIIAPGAGHRAKRWPPERFAEVAEHLALRGLPVAVIGGPVDLEDVREMMSCVNNTNVVDFSGRFSVEELKAFVSLSSLFISADTGPLFIAESFDIPTVCIAGPVDAVQPPRGPRNILIIPPREKAGMFMFNTVFFDEEESYRQSKLTQVDEVIQAVDSLL